MLVELGTPLDIPKLSSASSRDHRDYVELMSRHQHRNTESVKNIFLETDTPTVGLFGSAYAPSDCASRINPLFSCFFCPRSMSRHSTLSS
jgi:hypothetical protein